MLRLRCLYLLDSFAKNGKVKNKETFLTIIGLLIKKKDKEQTIIVKASLSQNRGQTTRLKLLNNWTCKSTKKADQLSLLRQVLITSIKFC